MIVPPQKICSAQRMTGTVEFSKQAKNLLNHKFLKVLNFVATILVTCVTTLTELDLSIQN